MNAPVPAHLLNQPAADIGGAISQGLGIPTPPYISIKGNRFTLVDSNGLEQPVATFDPNIGPYIDVAICDANPHVSKVYYADEYDPSQEGRPPACWSDNGVAPSSNAQYPQNDLCATCPNGQWGSTTSKMTGEAAKLCTDVKKIAVVLPQYPAMIFLFRIPPASLKNMRGYLDTISQYTVGNRRMSVTDIFTRVYFEAGKQGILNFRPAQYPDGTPGYVDANTYALLQNIQQKQSAAVVVGKTDQPRQGLLPAPQQQQPAQLAHPAAPQPQAQQPVFGGAAPQQPAQPVQQPQPAFGGAPQPQAPQPGNFGQPDGTAPQVQQPAPQAPRSRGRPRKGAEQPAQAPQQGAPQPGFAPQPQPGFAPQPQQAPQQPQGAPAFGQQQPAAQQPAPQVPAQGGFGTAPAAPSPADLTAALNNAFGAPPQ